jgi:hypothetical protein
VVKENGMDGLPDLHYSPESKGKIGNTTTDLHVRTLLLDGLASSDEVNAIVGVLLHAGADRKDVGVKDDVLGRELYLVDEDVIRTLADAYLRPTSKR